MRGVSVHLYKKMGKWKKILYFFSVVKYNADIKFFMRKEVA